MSTNPQDVFNSEPFPELLISVPRDAEIISQDELIEKAKQWQSYFAKTTARLDEEETNLGLSRWRIHCLLTGTYHKYEQILKVIHHANIDPLGEEPLDGRAHEAFKVFINNTQVQKVPSPLDVAFARDLTSHQQFAGVINEEELKATLVAYLKINPKEHQSVALNLSCNEYSLTITRVANRIQLIDSMRGIPVSIELAQKGTPAENELELTAAVNMLYENLLSKFLHINEEEISDYHSFRIDAYTPKSMSTQDFHLNPIELITSIYDKRKDSLEQQDEHSKTDALASAVQDGNKELVQFIERALGIEKLDACKKHAFEVAVHYGQYEFVSRYYKKEYIDENIMLKAYSSASQQVVNFLLDKGHRFEKKEFEKALVRAAEHPGPAFGLLLQYYDKFHKEQPDLINPAQLITASGSTLLNIAAKNDNIEALEALLARYDKDKNAKLFSSDASGKNCLHYLSIHESELFVAIARRNPALLFAKDKQGESPIFHFYKAEKELSANIYPLLLEQKQWYEAYVLALLHNEQSIINQCREHVTFSDMLKHEGDSRKGSNRFVDMCGETRFTDGRVLPFLQALVDINYNEQTQETLHDIYLLALKHDKLDIIKAILTSPTFNINDLFKDGDMVSAYPWYHLHNNRELFDYIVKNVDISKIDDQQSLAEFYLIALQLGNIDLCQKISSQIHDKSVLFLPGPASETDPYAFFEKDADMFNQFTTAVDFDVLLDALNPESSAVQSLALNQIYNLALMHNNQQKYEKCIVKLAKDANLSKSTDDLDVCYQSKNTDLFIKLFAMKSPSEAWCKKNFIKCLHDDNYEIAAAILEKFPKLELVNAQIDSIKGVSEPQHPLWVAIKENNVRRCQFLLEHNADPYMKRLHMISTTLMKEGLERAPLRSLFTSYAKFHQDKLQEQLQEKLKEKNKTEAHIHDIKDKFSRIIEQLKAYKKWDLSRIPTFLGGPITFEGVRFPKDLKGILDFISNTKNESSLAKLIGYSTELTKKIKSIDDKILPRDIKDKLIETINAPNTRLVALESAKSTIPATYKEFIKEMRGEQESNVKVSPMS
jgi:hypothetical protein